MTFMVFQQNTNSALRKDLLFDTYPFLANFPLFAIFNQYSLWSYKYHSTSTFPHISHFLILSKLFFVENAYIYAPLSIHSKFDFLFV